MQDDETLKQWAKRWGKIRHDAYVRLVQSYTPEQMELIRQVNSAARQKTLCHARLRQKAPLRDKRTLAWPTEPPA